MQVVVELGSGGMRRVTISGLVSIAGVVGALAIWPTTPWRAEEGPSVAPAQVAVAFDDAPADRDGEIFEQVMQTAIANEVGDRPFAQIVQTVAEQFLGAAYVDGLLDRAETEELVLSLTQFDCVLFVETVLAMARSIVARDYTYAGFGDRVEAQRYREGERDDYCSRLHYFSEWMDDNQKRSYLASINELQAQPLDKTLNFMTEHRSKYPRLVRNDANFRCIAQMETRLQSLDIQYVPTERVRQQYAALQAGDIIAIATSIDGIDVTHSGLAYAQPDGSIGFIHAAPGRGVLIAADLQRYVERVPRAIGILVARPQIGSEAIAQRSANAVKQSTGFETNRE